MRGVYLLLLRVNNATIRIGSLGEIKFTKGLYAYVGSAQNNLEARIKRHLSKSKKLHWHIDYLTTNEHTKVIKALYKLDNKEGECMMAEQLIKTEKPINKFGSSDCHCRSHLFKINNNGVINKLGLREL